MENFETGVTYFFRAVFVDLVNLDEGITYFYKVVATDVGEAEGTEGTVWPQRAVHNGAWQTMPIPHGKTPAKLSLGFPQP